MIKQQFTKFCTRPSTIARDQPFFNYLIKKGVFPCFSIPSDKVNSDHFFEKKSYKKFQEYLLENTCNKLEKHFLEYSKIKKNLIESAKALHYAIINKENNSKLLGLYKEYVVAAASIGDYMLMPYILKDHVEEKIREKFPNEFGIITNLNQATSFHLFQKSLLTDDTKTILEKFAWLNVYSPSDLPYTKTEIQELKKEISKENIDKTFREFDENEQKFQKFIESVPEYLTKKYCILMHKYAFLRTDRIDAWKEAMMYLKTFFTFLQEEFYPKGSISETVQLSIKEIEKLLEFKQGPNYEELIMRSKKQGFFFYNEEGFKFVVDDKEKKKLSESINKFRTDSDKIFGRSACKGYCTGKVKVIVSESDLKEFQEGEILVAKFTEPKYTIYMAKAKAIITDSGGITSHAAIVSREIGVPCIIGTEIATKILQSGDFVEVNADTGIIKILSKQKKS